MKTTSWKRVGLKLISGLAACLMAASLYAQAPDAVGVVRLSDSPRPARHARRPIQPTAHSRAQQIRAQQYRARQYRVQQIQARQYRAQQIQAQRYQARQVQAQQFQAQPTRVRQVAQEQAVPAKQATAARGTMLQPIPAGSYQVLGHAMTGNPLVDLVRTVEMQRGSSSCSTGCGGCAACQTSAGHDTVGRATVGPTATCDSCSSGCSSCSAGRATLFDTIFGKGLGDFDGDFDDCEEYDIDDLDAYGRPRSHFDSFLHKLCSHEYGFKRGLFGYFMPDGCCGQGCPTFGHYHLTYANNPRYFDARDGGVYAAEGYGVPMAVPLAPNVRHTYNYGWGIPSSRLTPISTRAPF